MGILAKVYRQRLSLLDDLYQLTMAARQLELVDRRYRELSAAPLYPVGMERELYQLKHKLIADRDCLRSTGGHSTGRPTAGTDRRIE